MSNQRVRLALGEKITHDGEALQVIEFCSSAHGSEVLLRNSSGTVLRRVAVRELLAQNPAVPVGEFVSGPEDEDQAELIGVILAQLTAAERELVLDRTRHVREVLTGYECGSDELAEAGEPRPGFEPVGPLNRRLEAKAAELEITQRTLQRWIADYRRDGSSAGFRNCSSDIVPTLLPRLRPDLRLQPNELAPSC